ncbi:MAG: sigma-70 family RNA polymerase sigma factor [Planctomycetes bacterium]|nr:sigma-70 family RNA polymerase sigma factor [Planctomycetota bacterium]
MTNPAIGGILDESSRDALALRHLDLVGRVVGRLPIHIPPEVDREDLVSVGTLGLLKAARTYQPARGASFRTFAFLAIRAAVLDELRRCDPLPRGARARLKQLASLEREFRAAHGRLPTPEEIALELNIGAVQVASLLAQSEEDRLLRSSVALDVARQSCEPVDATADEPSERAARNEELELVQQAIADLPQRERQVFVLYFSEGLYLKEIGDVLGVTESRVCQILACAQRKIRVRLDSQRKDGHA